MPTPELPNVWVVNVDGDDDIAGASCFQSHAKNIAIDYEPECEGDPEPEVHEYCPATEAKVLRAALEQAEADIRDLRAAIEKAVAELNLLADAADRERVPGWCAVDPGAARSVADALEAALKSR